MKVFELVSELFNIDISIWHCYTLAVSIKHARTHAYTHVFVFETILFFVLTIIEKYSKLQNLRSGKYNCRMPAWNWLEWIFAILKCILLASLKTNKFTCGRYYYKFIINGDWRHSTASPTERDQSGNLNNVIVVGDVASVRPIIQPQKKVQKIQNLYNSLKFVNLNFRPELIINSRASPLIMKNIPNLKVPTSCLLLQCLISYKTQLLFLIFRSSTSHGFLTHQDANIVKVIERPLTENERFMLAKGARCVAFNVCPIRLAPKWIEIVA